jgi:hypothetical protein
MLQIDISGIDTSTSDLKLILTEYGHPNNGHSHVDKGDQVHWKVKNGSGVASIQDIIRKPIYGSTDIFSLDAPKPQDGNQKKHWKGTVDENVAELSIYIYSITWVKEGESVSRVFDPIISIKPEPLSPIPNIIGIILGILGLSSVIY